MSAQKKRNGTERFLRRNKSVRKLDTALGFGIRRRGTTIGLRKLRFPIGPEMLFGRATGILPLRFREVNAIVGKRAGKPQPSPDVDAGA